MPIVKSDYDGAIILVQADDGYVRMKSDTFEFHLSQAEATELAENLISGARMAKLSS